MQLTCDDYKSKANLVAPTPVINAETLATATTISSRAAQSICGTSYDRSDRLQQEGNSEVDRCPLFPAGPDDSIVPPGSKDVKFALRAAYRPSFDLPKFDIRIALQSASVGTYFLAQKESDKGWDIREGALAQTDIDQILQAMAEARFWQLPFDGHPGMIDGEPILVEATFNGWRHSAMQNGIKGVDLAILTEKLKAIGLARNKAKPFSWWH